MRAQDFGGSRCPFTEERQVDIACGFEYRTLELGLANESEGK